jgi:hypothetical protein
MSIKVGVFVMSQNCSVSVITICAEPVVHPNSNKNKLTNMNLYGVILNMLIGFGVVFSNSHLLSPLY